MAQITVIVPVYKVEKYINRCVDSILTQSFHDFDLVLVDDGSPDTCPQICDAFAEKDERIVVIHKENGGLSDARNAGIDWAMEHSDSAWLAFVDSDDYLHPDYLQRLFNAAMKEAADLVICDFVRVSDAEEIVEEKHSFYDCVVEDRRELFARMMKNWRVVPAWNKLYGKSVFSELRFAVGKIHEDDFAIHHVLWNCRKAVFIPDGLYYYRIRSNSIMATETPKSRLDGFEALVERYEFCQSHQLLGNRAISIDFLHSYNSLKKKMSPAEKKRFRTLKKRFAKVFFSIPSNRNIKRFLGFYCHETYRKIGRMCKKDRSKT